MDNVDLLLNHGASPDAATKDMYTPLHIAAKEGHEEVASVLLDKGASLNTATKVDTYPTSELHFQPDLYKEILKITESVVFNVVFRLVDINLKKRKREKSKT